MHSCLTEKLGLSGWPVGLDGKQSVHAAPTQALL